MYDGILNRQDAIGDLEKYAARQDGTITITKKIIDSLEPLPPRSFEGGKSVFKNWQEAVNYYGAKETPQPPDTGRVGKIASTTLKPIAGTGKVKTRGVAASIESSSILKGITNEFGDLPQYRTVNWQDQAKKISDLMKNPPIWLLLVIGLGIYLAWAWKKASSWLKQAWEKIPKKLE